MKNIIYALGLVCICCLFTSCEEKLELSKCEELILNYPLFKETHVAVTDKALPGCEECLAGCVKGAYISLRGGNKDAYYYYAHGLAINNARELSLGEKEASCKFDLVTKDETEACKLLNERRIDGGRVPCMAYFKKFEDTGWKLVGISCEDRYFSINIWTGENIQYSLNFNYFEY